MLPPPPDPKRTQGVNVRFSEAEYERLKKIADYRQLPISKMLHYVIINSLLPKLEREVQKERENLPLPINATDELDGEKMDWLRNFEQES